MTTILRKLEYPISRWIGQSLLKGDWDFVWDWCYVQLDLLAIILFVEILVVFLMLVRSLWHLHEKKPIPQGVGHGIKKHKTGQALLTFLCKALLTFLGFVGLSLMTATVAHAAGPEDHPRYRNPPLLADGSTAPELSLRPPTGSTSTGSAAGYYGLPQAGTSAPASDPIPVVPEEIYLQDIYYDLGCQIRQIWGREPVREKLRLMPAYDRCTPDGEKALLGEEIRGFLHEKWGTPDLAQIEMYRKDLYQHMRGSALYREFREGMPRVK
jgi:hypothetical protein